MRMIALIVLVSTTLSFSAEVDILAAVEGNPELAAKIGLAKLNKTEKHELNALLNKVYEVGLATGAKNMELTKSNVRPGAARTAGSFAYETKIEDDKDDILMLNNGAVVQIAGGFLGYVGYSKKAVLYQVGPAWKIWIEGKKSFRCEILKGPIAGRKISAEIVSISDVAANGEILKLMNGSVLQVSSLSTIDTALWLPGYELLVLDEMRVVCLDDGSGGIIDVTKLK